MQRGMMAPRRDFNEEKGISFGLPSDIINTEIGNSFLVYRFVTVGNINPEMNYLAQGNAYEFRVRAHDTRPHGLKDFSFCKI